jgi:glycerate kinase
MRLNILIAPDKFKGTLTAQEAAEAIAEGWKNARPGDELGLLPISDGGDGFGEALSGLWRAKIKRIETVDATHRPIHARWWWEPKRKVAIIESAAVIGLAQLPPRRFHPFDLDTYGLGGVVRAAAKGARKCIIGVGGSATNDGGFGIARALGWQFLDNAGRQIQHWTGLSKLQRIIAPKRRRWFPELIVAVDVQNPLLGHGGATRVYGPQKGLRPQDFAKAEHCLRRMVETVKTDLGLELVDMPGTGAAGGLAFGLAAFLGARLEPGFDLFAREARLNERLRGADLVITGEGRLDQSTLMGKGVGEIARMCRRLNIPCIGLAGEVVAAPKLRTFSQIAGLADLTTIKAAMLRPEFWLARLAEMAAKARNVSLFDSAAVTRIKARGRRLLARHRRHGARLF